MDLDQDKLEYVEDLIKAAEYAKRIAQLVKSLGDEAYYPWIALEYRPGLGISVGLCSALPSTVANNSYLVEVVPIR